MRLIVADDDRLFGQAVQKTLTREGFAVDWVKCRKDFMEAVACNHYDFAILDLTLPDGSGEDILLHIRSSLPKLPVIVVSSCRNSCQRVSLLDQGADDFVVKPLDLDELVARVRCVLRRVTEEQFESASSVCGSLQLFSQRSSASFQGQNMSLTHREFAVLEVLVRKKNKIVSRAEIEDSLYAWGDEVESNAVEVYIHKLRRKFSPELIHTIRGVGYQLSPRLENAVASAG